MPTSAPPPPRPRRRWIAAAIAATALLVAVRVPGRRDLFGGVLDHWYVFPGLLAAYLAADSAVTYFVGRAYRNAGGEDATDEHRP